MSGASSDELLNENNVLLDSSEYTCTNYKLTIMQLSSISTKHQLKNTLYPHTYNKLVIFYSKIQRNIWQKRFAGLASIKINIENCHKE